MSEDLFVGEYQEPEAADDPVVSEVPVYLSTDLQPMIFQYPTRKLNTRAKEQTGSTLRIKAKSGQVQLDLNNDMPQVPPTAEKTAQTFGGMLKPSQRYAVGKIEQDGLYLAMVQSTAQLRPTFTHAQPEEKAVGDKPVSMRAVQMSAKSVENVQRYSEVIDYYKQVQKEEAKEYAMEDGSWETLK